MLRCYEIFYTKLLELINAKLSNLASFRRNDVIVKGAISSLGSLYQGSQLKYTIKRLLQCNLSLIMLGCYPRKQILSLLLEGGPCFYNIYIFFRLLE